MRRKSNPQFESNLQELVMVHSLGWLVAANLVGVWMALLLAKPELGALAGALTYGRWAPLHLNWHLYGWCSLPWVGMLLRHFLQPHAGARAAFQEQSTAKAGDGHRPPLQPPPQRPPAERVLTEARVALTAWSLALGVGGASWLAGESSGKLFLDWAGAAKWLLAGGQFVLWGVLFLNWRRRDPSWENRVQRYGNILLLAVLGAVPFLLCWSASREVYPPIDPGTGGPTGASLLGSTLGIILVLAMTPGFLGRKNRSAAPFMANGLYFGFSCAVYAVVNHHGSSHHEWSQIAAMATLLGWVPLTGWLLSGYDWNPGTRIWLYALLAWWGLLVSTGFAAFCPGILDRIKFTHALVAHAHLAMAGMLSCFNFLILSNLSRVHKVHPVHLVRSVDGMDSMDQMDPLTARPLQQRLPFILWQGGLALHLSVLLVMAGYEVADPGWTLRRESPAALLFWARFFAGAVMAAASGIWLWEIIANRIRNQISSEEFHHEDTKTTKECNLVRGGVREITPAIRARGFVSRMLRVLRAFVVELTYSA